MNNRIDISYRMLLQRRGFIGLLVAASMGRLAAGLLPFSLTAVFVQSQSFLTAGIVSLLFMLASSVTAPVRGRMIDQYSPRLALPVMTALATLSLVLGFVYLRSSSTSMYGVFWVLFAACVAPLNSVVLRSTWSIIASNEHERRALHALDSVLEECVFVCSPLLVTVLWVLIGPQWAILLGAATISTGTLLLFYFAYRSGRKVVAVFEARLQAKVSRSHFRKPIVMTAQGMALSVPMLCFALVIGFSSLAFAAWSTVYVVVAFTGVLAAATSAGGIIGGLIYGKLALSEKHAEIAYFFMPCLSAVFILLMAFTAHSFFSILVAFLIGLVMTPMFIAAFMRVPKTFARERLNEANASVGATYNVGAGIGALLAGYMLEHYALPVAFYAVALIVVSVVGVTALCVWSFMPDQPVSQSSEKAAV